MKKIYPFFGIFVLLAALVLVGFVWLNKDKVGLKPSTINSFEDCVAAGNPVQESYPARCTAAGKSFTEDIGNALEKQDLIRLAIPQPNQVVSTPLSLTGEARGNWFFEASFPVKIIDDTGKELGSVSASTTSEWMTEEFVPFNAILTFERNNAKKGKLILEKANPSDLSENADTLEIPVRFE
jgi:hypothetical protein